MKSHHHRGFTLIELLIVIAIIGLIATFAALGITNSRERARDTKRTNDLSQIRKAMELAFTQSSSYPVVGTPITLGDATHQVLCGKGTSVAFQPDQSASNCDSDKIYIGLIPPDPADDGSYTYTGTESTYCIQTALEVGSEGYDAGPVLADQDSLRNGICPP